MPVGNWLQRPCKIPGAVTVTIAAGRPDQRKRDLDNIAGKAVLDLLIASRHRRQLDLGGHELEPRHTNVTPGTIRVTVAPALSWLAPRREGGHAPCPLLERTGNLPSWRR